MSEIFSPKERPAIKKGGLVLAMVLCASLLSACDCDGDCSTGVAQQGTSPTGTTPSDGTGGGITTPTTTAPKCAAKDDTTKLTARFCKYDSTGAMLDDSATSWSCVEDTLLKNFWEVKTDDGLLRDKDWSYAKDGASGVTCGGTLTTCSPEAYAIAVNASATKPCGARTCSLPSHTELIYLALPTAAFPQPDGNAKLSTTTTNYAPPAAFFPEAIPSALWFNSTDDQQVDYSKVIPAGTPFNNVSDEGMAPPAAPTLAGHVRLICK
ncbi:MAG: hypothetical protein QJT81_19440 [Candidatus Thiothrix putei]|uniref:Lipoprotein n=1 Tax=Candidatus Thiothrix putei TaxID=3080811 RepID=A0AA95KP85_9GAMM|nr:MAG: hypothetical protein QJT81_19440 [Candidatus Thiothrix putei]